MLMTKEDSIKLKTLFDTRSFIASNYVGLKKNVKQFLKI